MSIFRCFEQFSSTMKAPKQTQSLDDCNDQDLNALRWLESRALKQIEKSTAQKQLQISNFFSPI